ncbi:MAG: hypothetical protein GF410_13740 [Chitinivibrionales bacterium]|nr:hypothetical protein [Chitinivibrionales bacterium]
MDIIETPTFTRQIIEIMSDDEYSELQRVLIKKPDSGKIIRGSGGIRKLRWASKGHGKRGGARILYFWFVTPRKLLMLFAFPKNVQADLNHKQLKILKQLVQEEYT